MKKAILISCVTLLATTMVLSQGKGKTASFSNDEAAIKALIEKETKAFFEIDYATWKACWAHVPHAFWSFADTTDVNSFSGWTAINNGFANYFKTSRPSTAKIERKWHDMKIYSNGAYVRFTQLVRDDTDRPAQEEVRVLEKINGQWKIVCVAVIAVQKDNEPIR